MFNDNHDLESMVSESLLTNDRMGNAIIIVEELHGTITLKGVVETEEDRLAAELLVRGHEGVIEVINQLKISRI